MKKAFIGSRLRQLRRERGLTQAAMAESLGISAAYVNMLEKNQRSLAVPVLMALSAHSGSTGRMSFPTAAPPLADLRPPFRTRSSTIRRRSRRVATGDRPCAGAGRGLLKLYQSHRAAIDNIMRLGKKMPADMVALSSETTIHDFFRSAATI